MISAVKDKTNKIKYIFGNDCDENCDKTKNKIFGDKKKHFFLSIGDDMLPNGVNDTKIMKTSQIETHNLGDGGSKDEVVSLFVKTSKRLQEMVQSYEAKVNQSTAHITCLQHHIYNLHDQLAQKNNTIGRVCNRYMALCKEKQTLEKHLQKKLDEFSSIVEACLKNDTPQLQHLLLQQVEKNRYLEYQNEILTQRINELCRQKPQHELKIL